MKMNETKKNNIIKLIGDENVRVTNYATFANAFTNIDALSNPTDDDEFVMNKNIILNHIDLILQSLTNEPCIDDIFNAIECE